MTEQPLSGRVAIITGASSGIGAATARQLAAAGASVVLAARREDAMRAIAQEIGERAVAVPCDVSEEAQVENLVLRTVDHFGAPDILVNNAGLGSFATVVDTTPEAWRRMIDVNLTGSFLCARAVLPTMLERGDGWIVNVCSDVSRRVFPTGAAYCASKFGQYALGLALGAEVRRHGVRVGSVLPGIVATEFDRDASSERDSWILRPEDVAEAVLFMVTRPSHAVIDELTVHPILQEY